MAFTASALSLIRSVFNRDRMLPQSYRVPAQANMTQYSGYAAYLSGMSPGSPNEKLSSSVNVSQDLIARYQDYSDMNSYPECGIALNIYADEATQIDPITQKSIWVESEHQEVKDILDHLLHQQLEVEENLWSWARQIAQKGNLFHEIIVFDGAGVVKLIEQQQEEVRRVSDKIGNDFGFIQDENRAFSISTDEFLRKLYDNESTDPITRAMNPVKVYEPWEVVHFRLRANTNGLLNLYGESILEPARWVWKRIQMMEDAMVLYKISRSPQRYVFYIDVGDMPPNEAKKEIQKVKNEFKKQKIVDPSTGNMSFQYNVMCITLDTKIPLLNGETKELSDLIEDFGKGITHWVYSIDREEKMVVPGKISWAGVTRKNTQIVEVTLDNGKTIRCTPDHKFILRVSGDYIEAKDLQPGDSLMPFYKYDCASGRPAVFHPSFVRRDLEGFEFCHRMVARSVLGDIEGKHVHHKDRNYHNNSPDNLDVLLPQEHFVEHQEERSESIREWNKTPEHSKNTSKYNRIYNKGKNIVEYNNSEQHGIDNKIRSESLSRLFRERHDEMCSSMRIKFPDRFLVLLKEFISNNPGCTQGEAIGEINSSEMLSIVQTANSRCIPYFQRHHLDKVAESCGFDNWGKFKNSVFYNHKVQSVRFIEQTEDTGCITVERWHNFAVESGVFIKNSCDEDFFIAKRKEKRTSEIELLSGLDGQQVDDTNYFREKMFTALGVPKSYMGADETIGRANLGMMDVRLAKSVMRLQRALKNGFRQICDVDLASRNIDPSKVEYKLKMVIPSGALEIAQIEVQRAKVELAQQYQQMNFPDWYIWTKILGMTDDEAMDIVKMREANQGEEQQPTESKSYLRNPEQQTYQQIKQITEQHMNKQSQILDMMDKKNNLLGRRLNELKGLAFELKHALR